MGKSQITALFAPVGSFFEERADGIRRDVERLKTSAVDAASSYANGNRIDLPVLASNVTADAARFGRRFSPMAPALTAYSLIAGREGEEALVEEGVRHVKRAGATMRFGLELGILAFANISPVSILDGVLGDGFKLRSRDSRRAFEHSGRKFEAHFPDRVLENFHMLDHVEGREREECWAAALDKLKSQGKDMPWNEMRTYSDFLGYLNAGGIFYVERVLSVECAVQLVENRRRLSSLGSDRPIVVVVGNKNDHNQAFAAKYGALLDKLVEIDRFDVVYFEVESDREAVAALTRVYQTSGHKVSLAVFSGHGSPDSVRFGGGDDDETWLDVSDFTDDPNLVAAMDEAIAEDGQVLYQACSTGSPELSENLMRVTAKALPGREVFGTSIANSLDDLRFQGARLRDVKWDKGHREYQYVPVEGTEEGPMSILKTFPPLNARFIQNHSPLWRGIIQNDSPR
ncbi:MAG: hypothetical protein IT572_08655 [Deltaproteobacteria bacterium]|nr:hypothetical protein [Deltaproteobacteria bacterium]